jgi:flagellar biosynthesis/type III secretory pathway protein FliH
LQKPEGFRSLAELLREPHESPAFLETLDEPANETSRGDELAAAREVRFFQAHLSEALESAIEVLRNDIATEVVGRELQLAPAEIEDIVRRAVRRFAAEGPLCIRVHPDDLEKVSCEVPSAGDCALRRGDAVLEVRTGTIDASLGVRLESVLRAFR